MRLIDADKAQKQLDMAIANNNNPLLLATEVKEFLEVQPTVEERKHGHWVVTENTYQCQFCQYWDTRKKEQVNGRYVFSKLPNYCPYCGAEMDEEV